MLSRFHASPAACWYRTPDSSRLRIALRAALACLLTGFASIAWTIAHHQPVTLAAPGILFGMVAPLFVRDARRPAWFVTLLSLYVCACACFAAAAALSRYPLAGDAGFLLVMFAGMLCQACGRARSAARCSAW